MPFSCQLIAALLFCVITTKATANLRADDAGPVKKSAESDRRLSELETRFTAVENEMKTKIASLERDIKAINDACSDLVFAITEGKKGNRRDRRGVLNSKNSLIDHPYGQLADFLGKAGSPGKDGLPGKPGPAGKPGPPGKDGSPGKDGLPGKDGQDGTPGGFGRDGLRGAKGEMGLAGPTGSKGEVGSPGSRGMIGPAGPKGVKGPPGSPGRTGTKGELGQTGQLGSPGLRGSPGSKGTVGAKGESGPTGPPGKAGTPGAKGEVGLMGPPGKTGPRGATGKIGPDGSQGRIGPPGGKGEVGPVGPKGAVGSPGRPGKTGLAGSKGERGLPGVSGKKGSPGVQGIQGKIGPPGGSGSRGAKGETGATGPPGQIGLPGAKGKSIRVKSGKKYGAVYTRWGRTTCGEKANLLYEGFASTAISGVGYQCMPPEPLHNKLYSTNTTTSQPYGSKLGSVMYAIDQKGIFSDAINGALVPCARCSTMTRPSVMMLPSMRDCKGPAWTKEYEGYLMTETLRSGVMRLTQEGKPLSFRMVGRYPRVYANTLECVDQTPEKSKKPNFSGVSSTFSFTSFTCTNPANCYPFVSKQPITCVVCSK